MKRFFLIITIAFALTSCVKEDVGDISKDVVSKNKIFNWGEDAAQGRLMVRLAEGVKSLHIDGVALDVEPLFPTTCGDAKLNRWMLVRFDEALDVRSVAEAIALDDGVERVEFDLPMKRIKSETLPMPTSRPEPTRSVTMPFDDPELPWQWH